jgi:D-alanyl-lipoteichoic acid acyltransferase DltB (MBOAT superfamily)
MGLSGLWHGAAWNFVIWGLYHGALLFIYRAAGLGGRWRPEAPLRRVIAWGVMFVLVMIGWAIFRATDMGIFTNLLTKATLGFSGQEWQVALLITALTATYGSPFLLMALMDRHWRSNKWVGGLFSGAAMVAIVLLHKDGQQDFIYFQF